MSKYKRFDVVTDRLGKQLQVGSTYRLGIANMGYLFSHYEVAKIQSVTVHSEYSTSYGCYYKGNTFAARWDQPYFRFMTRIVSADEERGIECRRHKQDVC